MKYWDGKKGGVVLVVWGIVIFCVCLFGGVYVTVWGVPWVEVDLYIPNSFRPFTHDGSRLGVSSVWSSSSVLLKNFIGQPFEAHLPLEDLAELSMITTYLGASADVLVMLQDIQKQADFFNTMTIAARTLSVLGLLVLLVCLLRATFCLSKKRLFIAGITRSADGRGFAHIRTDSDAIVPALFSAGVWTCGSAGLLSLVTGLVYAVTIQADAKVLLPSALKRMQLLCITHDVHNCRLHATPLQGAFIYTAVNATQILAAWLLSLLSTFIDPEHDMFDDDSYTLYEGGATALPYTAPPVIQEAP